MSPLPVVLPIVVVQGEFPTTAPPGGDGPRSRGRIHQCRRDELARAGFAAVSRAGQGELEVLLPEGEESPLAAVLLGELRRWLEQHHRARIELEP